MDLYVKPAVEQVQEIVYPTENSVYIDMGRLYGTYVIGNMIRWWPEPVCIDQEKLDTYLESFFGRLTADKTTKLELAFTQLSDIQNLVDETEGSPTDTITQIFAPMGHDGPYPVGDTGPNFLTYFNNAAEKYGIGANLSFGGAIATSEDMTILEKGKTSAKELKSFLDTYHFKVADFDVEGAGVTYLMESNPLKELRAFFSRMKGTLTLAGSLQDGPLGPLAPLFKNYSKNFSGLNLMLYSQTQYYLDANNETWGIVEWINTLKLSPTEAMKHIHIGFYDAIDYTNPASSAGKQYDVPCGLKNGAAAAYVYKQLLKDVGEAFPGNRIELGAPFLWTDEPSKLPENTFMEDFFGCLSNKE